MARFAAGTGPPHLILRVEANREVTSKGAASLYQLRKTVEDSIQKMLGLRTAVEIVAADTYPRTDFKARRVIDDREVFKEMAQRLHSER